LRRRLHLLLFTLSVHLLDKLFDTCDFLRPGLLWRHGDLGVDPGFILKLHVKGVILRFDRLDHALDQGKLLLLNMLSDIGLCL
jgi:hypothetical protein